jgi:predicted Zn-ribbon and HTH transcriptional regulator
MTISMDRFASEGQFAKYDPFARAPQRIAIFTLQCRQCGFEPDDAVLAPRFCPKCHGQAWERFAKPGSVLENAERY